MYRYTSGRTRERPPRPPLEPFIRDAPTWLGYGSISAYAFWLYAFGPALSLLRDQLGFSYTVLGLYAALWSLGTALAGVTFPLLARRVSRHALMWSSSLLASVGAVLFMLGTSTGSTLAAAWILGWAGTILLTVAQAILSDRHQHQRDRALTEANVFAGVCAVVAPLLLGVLASAPGGWQSAFALPILALAALFVQCRRVPLPTPAPAPETHDSRRLPLAARLYVGMTAAGMALEFCVVYFGAELLTGTGLSTASAATAMSSYYLGILLGRIAGAVVTARPGRAVPLLYTSLVVTIAGFMFFWLSSQSTVAVLGLFVAGVGTANLYPVSLALTIGAAPGRHDRANASTQTLGGLLVGAAPYLLGDLADRLTLTKAFAVEPVLIGLCLVLLVAGLRTQRHS